MRPSSVASPTGRQGRKRVCLRVAAAARPRDLRSTVRQALCLACLGLAASTVSAWAGFAEEAANTRPDFNIRYRLETVDQDGVARKALASTAKLRGSWIMDDVEPLSVGIEVDHVQELGSERYHSLANGRTGYPVVADPTGTDLNQVFVRLRNGPTTLVAGRQRIIHDEQRFVGGVAWRQNEQTYDGVRIEWSGGPMALDYSYVWNVRRIFGPDDGLQPAEWQANAHFLRAPYQLGDGHTVAAFTYLLDLENDNGPANSNASFGLDYKGAFGQVGVSARAALQREWGANPVSYDAPYYFVEAKLPIDSVTFAVGREVLGSDGGTAPFRTPLGTLHKFQGWTDKFLSTPPAGVADTYLTVSGSVGSVDVVAAVHAFAAAEGGMNYGREAGLSAVWPLGPVGLQFKLAHYGARDVGTDTAKVWVVLNYAF